MSHTDEYVAQLRRELTLTRLQRDRAAVAADRLQTALARTQESIRAAAKRPKAVAESAKKWEPPLVMPPKWRLVQKLTDGAKYERSDGLVAIVSVDTELDERGWVHLSVSHPKRLPGWGELLHVRDLLLGDVLAVQVLPTSAEHVNIHDHVLHLWHCLDGPPLPDFTRGTGSL